MTADETNRHQDTAEEERKIREAALDQTIEASFPASDPPSSNPNPDDDDAVDPGGNKPTLEPPESHSTAARATRPYSSGCAGHSADQLADLTKPQHRTCDRGTEHPILGAQAHGAECALKKWRVQDHDLEQE